MSSIAPRQRRLSAILTGLAVLIVAGLLALLPRTPHTVPPGPAIGGPFSLVDQTGRAVTDENFRGKLLMVYFGFTLCPDFCPTTLSAMGQAYDRLTAAEQAQITPVFITVDPEHDGVAQMAQYVGAFSPALVGLTGSPEQIKAVIASYRVFARKAGTDGVDHSSIIYLMGKQGQFVSHLDGGASADAIAAGVRKALAG